MSSARARCSPKGSPRNIYRVSPTRTYSFFYSSTHCARSNPNESLPDVHAFSLSTVGFSTRCARPNVKTRLRFLDVRAGRKPENFYSWRLATVHPATCPSYSGLRLPTSRCAAFPFLWRTVCPLLVAPSSLAYPLAERYHIGKMNGGTSMVA